MPDREKVKYSIERCISHVPDACRDCAYDAGHPYNECVEMMLNDVLALLKEQGNLEERHSFLVDKCDEMMALLKEQESVARCKDCVHWIPGTITDKDDFIQPRCKRNGGGWSSDDYCSCAERREAACTSDCMS